MNNPNHKSQDGAQVSSSGLLAGHRVELRCDGKLILGTSVAKRPENHGEMVALIKEIVAMMEAPDVPDHELF